MKKIFPLILCLPFTAFAQQANNPMKNAVDSISYALGMNISSSLIQQGITELNLGVMTQAFMDVFTNKEKAMTAEFSNALIQQKMQELAQKKMENGSAAIGKVIPDFSQTDANGKSINIKSLRGKYVLIDFWASWCGPCRGENPNVVAAYNKYKDKNFTVLGISLDSKKENWMKAISDDGLTWQHVSDLKGWSNQVAQQFGITSIPQNFLIDPNGVVIDKNLRGEALEAKLESILK